MMKKRVVFKKCNKVTTIHHSAVNSGLPIHRIMVMDDPASEVWQHARYGELFEDHVDKWGAADGSVGTAVQCELVSLIFASF